MRRRVLQIWGMLALCASCAWGTPSITQVNVRQQWPWSADIAVDFRLSNDEGTPVDVSIVASNHNQSVNIPTRAVSGPRIGLTASGDYRLVIDSAKLDAGDATVLGDFSVTLSIAASRADRDFALYRIYNLSTKTSTDVTVKALLNGEWGDVETDYAFAGGTYRPDDVLIWTGVTNNPAYKTNCLVMRYVPAGTYTMLEQRKSPGTEVTLTSGFYVGVFEATQGQCELLKPGRAQAYYTNSTYAAMRPMGSLSLGRVRGDNSRFFPQEYAPGAESYVGMARTITHDTTFDLPTEAQWEYAARAGCAERWYNGATGSDVEIVSRLARHADNGGLLSGSTIPDWDSGPENGTAIVGSYIPNAYGLYDCIGNVNEICRDRFSDPASIIEGGPYTDPVGSDTVSEEYHVLKGGHYARQYNASEPLAVDCRFQFKYSNNYESGNSSLNGKDANGFRLICGAAASRPAVAGSAVLATATASADAEIALKPDVSPFWRTANAGEPVTMSIVWPDGAATATCTLSAVGQVPLSATAVRNGSARYATLSLSLPVPLMPDEERVYAAELTFADANDAPLADATQQAQIAVVLGQDGSAAVVRAESGDAWTRYLGTHVTLPVAAGTTSLTIDGTTVYPGLDGAVGWYGTTLTSGMHTLAIDEEEGRTIFFKGLGLQIIIR